MAIGEWDRRQLCPDGGCVGVIGPDGTCKVCHRAAPNWGDERTRGLIDPPDDENGDDENGDDENGDDENGDDENGDEDEDEDKSGDEDDQAPGDAAAAPPGGWDERTLCPDGSCIGVIGPDGHCGVCGKVAT